MKQFKNIRAIALITLGFILILAYIYFRFMKERIIVPLFFIKRIDSIIYIDYMMCFITCIFICLFSIGIILNILLLLKKKLTIQTNIITTYLAKIVQLILDSLQYFIAFVMKLNVNSYQYMKICITKFLKYFDDKFVLLITLYYTPYIIMCSVFLYDVFLNFSLNYFYKSLPLVVLSLTIKLWFFLMADFSSNKDQIKNYVEIKYLKDTNRFVLQPYDDDPLKDKDPRLIQYWLKYFGDELSFYLEIDVFLNEYRKYETYIRHFILLIVYTIYLCGWVYVVLKNVYTCYIT